MTVPMTYAAHLRAILTLGLPLIGGHLAQFVIGLTDTVMLGWYGIEDLAAVTLAHGYFFAIFMFGSGFAMAVMPMVATAAGMGDTQGIRRSTRMGLWLSFAFGLLVLPTMLGSGTLLRLLGQEGQVADLAASYLRMAGWGLFPALLVMVLKSYLAALERTRVVLWITLMSAATNALVNYVLIFGHWGAPELGALGAAIASVATQTVALLAVVLYASRIRKHMLFRRLWRPDWEMFARVFRLGLPIGLTLLSEVSLFAASAFMMGWLGAVPLAAHGIVMTVTSATFMVHLGLSNVATIRTGNAFGRGNRAHMRRGALAVCVLSLAFAICTITAFLVLPDPILALFLDSADPARPEVMATGVTLLALAALFQLVDGAQVIALGLLRGVQDTAVPMVVAVLSYWAVGIPASYILGFRAELGATGIWLGLTCGLACAGTFLMLRFWSRAIGRVPQAMPAV